MTNTTVAFESTRARPSESTYPSRTRYSDCATLRAIQQPTPNHQGETFGSGETQFFECEALSADHPEIQARERARQQRLQLANPREKQARPATDGEAEKST